MDPFTNFKIGSLKVSIYRMLTLTIFHTLNIIKQMGTFPEIMPNEQILFEFKKPGFNKLLIFDLDETLIHSLRSGDEEDEDFPYVYDEA